MFIFTMFPRGGPMLDSVGSLPSPRAYPTVNNTTCWALNELMNRKRKL